MNDIMEIVQALEDSNILFKGVTETIKNEAKEQEGGSLGTLVGTLGSILLGNLVSGKGIVRACSAKKKRKRNCKSWLWKWNGFSLEPHPLTNFDIKEYYRYEKIINGVFSRDNLPKKIKDETYVINLDEYADVGTHWVALFCKKMKLFISIVLVWNTFLKKLKHWE